MSGRTLFAHNYIPTGWYYKASPVPAIGFPTSPAVLATLPSFAKPGDLYVPHVHH